MTNQNDTAAKELVAEAVTQAFHVTETAAAKAKEVVAAASDAALKQAATTRHDEQEDDDRVARALATALRKVFGENQEKQRFIDVSRIPLICQHIDGIHNSIKEIEAKLDSRYLTVEAFGPYRKALNAIAGLVLVAIVGGLLSLVIIK